MRDTTLNLIAITIFGLTMMALLGPMVDLSPAVVAIAVVGILGVATVDQLGLEGRAGNIFLDILAWTSEDHRQRVLHHEAGHFLVAELLGIPVVNYSLNTWDAWRRGIPGQGGVVFDIQGLEEPLATGRLPALTVDAYGQVWMAGIAAEQMVYGTASGGQDDRLKFTQLWQQMGRSPAEGQIKQRWSVLQAKTLLEQHEDTFHQLAQALANRASVTDCQRIIRAATRPDKALASPQTD